MVEKIYAGILLYRFRKVTEGLIDEEQGGSEQGGGRLRMEMMRSQER